MERYGTVKINLAKLIEDSGLSKNKLSHRAEMQRTQINHYCNNEVTLCPHIVDSIAFLQSI